MTITEEEVVHVVLGALIVGLGGTVKYMIASNNRKHQDHYAHAANPTVHPTPGERAAVAEVAAGQLAAHERLDDERFGHLETAITALQNTCAQMLTILTNGRN